MPGPLLVLLGALCFSTMGLFQAIAPEGATPFVIASARMLTGSIALFIYLRARGLTFTFDRWPWKYVALYVAGMCFFQVAFLQSLLLVGVAVGAVVTIGTTPIFCGLFSWISTGRRPHFSWIIATAVAISGLILINQVETGNINFWGLALAIAAGATYGINIQITHHLTRHHSPESAAMLTMGLVGLVLMPSMLFYPAAWIATFDGIGIVLGLGVVSAAIGYGLSMAGLKTTPAHIASTLALGEPLGAALIGILVLEEPWTVQTLGGIACLFLSVLILLSSSRTSK